MKFIYFVLGLFISLSAFSNERVQEIYAQAAQLLEESSYKDNEEELLYQLYCEKIAQLDNETIQKYPELIFRKAVAGQDVVSPENLSTILKDFQFVMSHSEEGSRLFKAAQAKSQVAEFLMKAAFLTEEEAIQNYLLLVDPILSQWATNPLATGTELRQEVFSNIQQNPDVAASFYDYLLFLSDSADVALKKIPPDEIAALGVFPEDDGAVSLVCKMKYHTSLESSTVETIHL